MVALLDDLGRRLVADVRVERRADRRATTRRRPGSRSTSASMPATQRSANSRRHVGQQPDRLEQVAGDHRQVHVELEVALATRRRRRRRRCRSPARATWVTASGMTGFTLPGMIDEPGCRSGRRISARPVRGPLPIQRRSLAILTSATASVAQLARQPRPARRARPGRRSGRGASVSGRPSVARRAGRSTAAGEAGFGALRPVPTAVPPSGSSPTRGQRVARAARSPSLDLRGVAAELLAERDRRGVHQVGAARPSRPSANSRCLAPQRAGAGARAPGSRSSTIAIGRGEVDGRREHVVGRLRGVDVVVGVHRPAEPLATPGWRAPRSRSCSSDVPEPVWNTSIGNWSSHCARAPPRPRRRGSPSATSSASTPSSALTVAAAPLIEASAPISARSIAHARRSGSSRPPAGSARPTGRAAGTRTSPIVSCSMRNSSVVGA